MPANFLMGKVIFFWKKKNPLVTTNKQTNKDLFFSIKALLYIIFLKIGGNREKLF
jgi:hypothetical protein